MKANAGGLNGTEQQFANISKLQNQIEKWDDMYNALKELEKEDFPYFIAGLSSGLQGFFLNAYFHKFKETIVIVVPTEQELESVKADLDFSGAEVHVLPAWSGLPYRAASAGSPVFPQRAEVLCKLASYKKDKPFIFILTQRALQSPVPPPQYTTLLNLDFKCGEKIDLSKTAEILTTWGYTRVPRVSLRGEFALRGEVLDICLASNIGSEGIAYRIQFDYDKIEKIKSFELNSQASVDEHSVLSIFPMKEIIWTDERIEMLSKKLKADTELSSTCGKIIPHLKEHRFFEGEELFYPLSFEKSVSVLDYLDNSTPVFYIDYDRQANAADILEREYLGMYKKTKTEHAEYEKHKFLIQEYPAPQYLLLSFSKIVQAYKKNIFFKTLTSEFAANEKKLNFTADPAKSFFGNIVYLKETLTCLLQDNWQIFIFAETGNQALRIKQILQEVNITVLPFGLSAGFGIPALKILVIHENEIFGRRRRIPKSVKTVKSSVIDTFVELNCGDFVVHVNYGIGCFKGIERVKILDTERDYINLLYANDETVFIPIEQADLVQRYIGNEGEPPKLDVLGSKSWENRKKKVKKSVEDIAAKLIDLYSRRKACSGYAFQKDDEWQLAFEAAFPYEETKDQITCISEVKTDMEKPVPMDRLICGDVGYGKTEVAMRAAFKAVMGGKQVAFLAPTTILAEQHFETLDKRFKNFPVKLAKLSRFVSAGEQKKVLKQLFNGDIDIMVGTHRILQKDVVYKDLGLIVIDEEQRFGVKDKERLKGLKTSVDCLTMSATPIPRTLHMSLLKIRDMSLITTPPQNRKPVETVIAEFSPEKVAEAVRRETDRGGQVFYLHNRVESLEDTKFMLQRILPEMLIGIAHGKMPPEELEEIFRRFNVGGFQILLATTIIENGIDIPNANTIIIDRADMYGVSQLYQLRGRVGRSDKKAYAYLFYPQNKSVSELAMKRLQVISDFTELGSGFKIAMKDMEIRGAGNLLGKEQSGDIYSVGFDLYLRLLEEAIERLKNSDYCPQNPLVIELEYSGFIPDTYISVPETKMEIYKKIAAVKNQEDFDNIIIEINDRFGPPPAEVESLLALSEIKIICNKLFISSLKERDSLVRIEFSYVSKIPVEKIIRVIKESAGRVRLDPECPNVIMLKTEKIGLKEKSEFILKKLGELV